MWAQAKVFAGVVGTDALGKVVAFAVSPILASMLRPDAFGAYVLLQAIWAVVMLAQFGGADWALPLRAGEAGPDGRDEAFAGCNKIASRVLPFIWLMATLLVLAIRPGDALTAAEYALFMGGLLPAGYAAWQLYLLRFARHSTDFAKGPLCLKTVAPLVALAAAVVWPAPDQRLVVFLAVGIASYSAVAFYTFRLRRAALHLESVNVAPGRMRQLVVTGLTLIPGGLAYAALWSMDRIVANAMWGPAAAGIVGVAALLGSTVLIMKVWLSLIWDPLVVEWSGGQLGTALIVRIQRAFDWTALCFLAAATYGVIWGPWVVTLLYPQELSGATDLLPWYFMTAAVSGIAGIASATILLARAPRAHLATQITALCAYALTVAIAAPLVGVVAVVAGLLAAEVTILLSWLFLGSFYFRNLPLRLHKLAAMTAVFAVIGYACQGFRGRGFAVEVAATAVAAAIFALCSSGLARIDRQAQIA
jgi:O-antigen/teichoic acid export membrane protein